jgi:AcrR family transcriptional regulator
VYGVYMSMSSSRQRLDLSRLVQSAIGIADAEGLDAVSMRHLADRLGVTPMALYKHVANRAQLVDEMLDVALAGVAPVPLIADWADTVRARILAVRDILAVHPWVREAIETREGATPRTLAHMDSLMAAMFDGGLSADLVHHAMHALSTRMWGFTRDVLPTPEVPDDPVRRAEAMAEFAKSYPAIIRMATTSPHAGAACDDASEFAFALDLILGGIQRLHDAGWERSVAARELLDI